VAISAAFGCPARSAGELQQRVLDDANIDAGIAHPASQRRHLCDAKPAIVGADRDSSAGHQVL